MKTLYFALGLLLIQLPAVGQMVKIEKETVMLSLGDSYTIGASVDWDGRWPHQLMDTLRKLGVEGPEPDYIARTGWTTGDLWGAMQSRINEDKSYNLVSVLIGVNNQYQGIDVQTYYPDLKKILDRALSLVGNDTSRVMMLSIPDYAFTPFGGGSTSISEEIEYYNDINRRTASEYRIAYFDITDISRQGIREPELVAGDGLHPSDVQYFRWVERIIPGLELQFTPLTAEMADSGEDIRIYPNPAGSVLYIEHPGSLSRVQVADASGGVVDDLQVREVPFSLDTSMLDPGLYTLLLYQKEHIPFSSRSFIVR